MVGAQFAKVGHAHAGVVGEALPGERMDLWQQWEAVLHCHDDPDREARARLFCDANREAMDA